MSGARVGVDSWLRRQVAWALSRDLTAFVVPGVDVARAHGLDLGAAGLRVVPTPRHAGVLVLVGEIPDGLAPATTVVYAQMPRPRAILTIGADQVFPLPAPDVAVALDQDALVAGVRNLSRFVEVGAWVSAPPPSDVPAVRPETDDQSMDMDTHTDGGPEGMEGMEGTRMVTESRRTRGGEGAGDGDGSDADEPVDRGVTGGVVMGGGAGTTTQDSSVAVSHEHHEHHGHAVSPMDGMGHMDHGDAVDGSDGGMDTGHGGMRHSDHDGHDGHDGMQHDNMGGMDMGGMHMGGGGMSMVMMTQDLPRSPDGLPMEWVEAPFGPLFPGLPGGLALTFTLDGDAVADATFTPGMVARGLASSWPGAAATLPARLARLDPLAPVAYRLLAIRALEDAAGVAVDEGTARARVGALERERAVSHFGWLAGFAALLGDHWIAERAATLQRALLEAVDVATVARLERAARAFVRRVRRTPYLHRRLAGIGQPRPLRTAQPGSDARVAARVVAWGPTARAAGVATDARADDPVYRRLGFAPVVRAGNDAWARLDVRLAEVAQSLALVVAADALAAVDAVDAPDHLVRPEMGGVGAAVVETPRGAATLRLTVADGVVHDLSLATPSARLAPLIAEVAEGREVADALAGVASLDLSPWEMDR